MPSYIAELSISSIRGILTGLFEVSYQMGSLVGFWINYGINENMNVDDTITWRIPMAVQLIPSGLLFIGTLFLHESPLWLFRKDRDEQALKSLEELRHLPRDHPCKPGWDVSSGMCGGTNVLGCRYPGRGFHDSDQAV